MTKQKHIRPFTTIRLTDRYVEPATIRPGLMQPLPAHQERKYGIHLDTIPANLAPNRATGTSKVTILRTGSNRIGTTTSAAGWDDYTVSTGDEDGWNAPNIQVIGDRQIFQRMGRQYAAGRQPPVGSVAFAE